MDTFASGEEDRDLITLLMSETLTNSSSSPPPPTTEDYRDEDDGTELYQVPVSIVILLSLAYGAISVAALVGNFLVLWVVAISRRMRTVTNMFIANLAFADIIIGLFAIPFQFQAALLQRWDLPHFMCAFCPFVQVLSVNVSVFTLSAIAVDRYRAVLYPLSARASKRRASFVIIAIWTLGILLAFPTEIDFKVIEKRERGGAVKPFCQNEGLSEEFRKYYLLGLVVIQYFLPLIIISGAYAHMATRLWGSTAPGNREESRDAVVLRNKKRVIKMLALVVLLFAVCWCPLQMYNFFQSFIPAINEYQYINIIWFSFHWLAMSNSCCNPFIYAIYNDKFQREFKSRLHFLRICQRGRGSDSPPCSEMSEMDRSRVRASYRFKTDGRGGGGGGEGNTSSSRGTLTLPKKTLNHQDLNRSQRRHNNNSSTANSTRRNNVNVSGSKCDGPRFSSTAPSPTTNPTEVIVQVVGNGGGESRTVQTVTFAPTATILNCGDDRESGEIIRAQLSTSSNNNNNNMPQLTITITTTQGDVAMDGGISSSGVLSTLDN